jgi:hypothetical protein
MRPQGATMTSNITLFRTDHYADCTLGILNVENFQCYTIERPWLNNKPRKSCIPKGTYRCIPHGWEPNTKVKKKRTWEITNVPDRSAILIHIANTASQLEGCVAVGQIRGRLNGKHAVLESAKAINRLREIIGNNVFTITII